MSEKQEPTGGSPARRRVTPSLERMVTTLDEMRANAGQMGDAQVESTARLHLLLGELACDPRIEISTRATELDELLLAEEADVMELYEKVEALIALCKKKE